MQLELCRVDGGIVALKGGLGRGHAGDRLVVLLLGDVTFLDDGDVSFELFLGVFELGLVLGEIGLCLLERRLERPRIDGEEQITRLDVLTICKMNRQNRPIDL